VGPLCRFANATKLNFEFDLKNCQEEGICPLRTFFRQHEGISDSDVPTPNFIIAKTFKDNSKIIWRSRTDKVMEGIG